MQYPKPIKLPVYIDMLGGQHPSPVACARADLKFELCRLMDGLNLDNDDDRAERMIEMASDVFKWFEIYLDVKREQSEAGK